MLIYQFVQIVTVITGLAGAAVAAWHLNRTLRSGMTRTLLGGVSRGSHPRLFRTLVVLYGIGFAILLGAAAISGMLLANGRY